MNMIYDNKIMRLMLFPIIVLDIFNGYANTEMNKFEFRFSIQKKNQEIKWLNYEEYRKWAIYKLNGLKLTIILAENVHDRIGAYLLLFYMEKVCATPPWIGVDINKLDSKQIIVVYSLKNRLDIANIKAFSSLLESCENIVKSDGYGDNYIRSYYEKKLNELKIAVPISNGNF